jgi:hypothetical protein
MARRLIRRCALLLALGAVAGCGGGGDGESPPPPPTPASKLFVGDSGSAAIGSSPNSNPAAGPAVVERIITGGNTMLTSSLADFALDLARDRLYVSDRRSILAFDNVSTAAGNVAPRVVATCCGGVGGLGNYTGLSLDTVNDRLYAAVNNLNAREVFVYDGVSALTNAIVPTRSMSISGTFVMDVAIDPTRNILYVHASNSGTQIAVFDNAALLSGTVTANRTIVIGDSFSSGTAVGIFLDTANNRLYAPRFGQVLVFDNVSAKDGTIGTTGAPERRINLPILDLVNIAVDLTANRLYAADNDGLNIIDNASTADGTPPTIKRVLAASGSDFKAVAVKP